MTLSASAPARAPLPAGARGPLVVAPTPPAPAALSPDDLAGIVESFNAVVAKLQATHETLTREVASLKGELSDAKEQVARSKRLAALGEMAAGIAHEVRNPLGSIRLYARMLQTDLADRPEQQRIAERIAGAVTGLDAVVSDVLSFAREVRPRAASLDAGELFAAALAAARSDAPCWKDVVVKAPRPGAGPLVSCDPGLMNQALVNVIRNAVDAMDEARTSRTTPSSPDAAGQPPPPRVLTLHAGTRRVRWAASGAEAGAPAAPAAGPGPRVQSVTRTMMVLSIKDTGPGIPPAVMERMFNPFFTTRATGTGLGLAIVNRIVDAHDGRVAVKNAPSDTGTGPSGAVVEIILPPGDSP